MSFAHEIKKEILEQEYSVDQAIDLLSGIIAISSEKHDKNIVIKFNNHYISQSIQDLFLQLDIKTFKVKNNKNWIQINDFEVNRDVKMPSQFFAGLFVGGGSISDPLSTSYHLEMQFLDGKLSTKVKTYLNKYGFNFVEIKRRNNWVLYIKKSEMITDFLRVIGVFNGLMVFEDARINRDFKNQLNRYSNLDSYNQKKLAKSNIIFQEEYKAIKDHNLLHLFSENELLFYVIKSNNPYSSLAELVPLFNKKNNSSKTKSAINHYLIKLRKIVGSI